MPGLVNALSIGSSVGCSKKAWTSTFLVDDHAVDAIVRGPDGAVALVQIKARSASVVLGDAALFAAIDHDPRDHYWFIFYSERLDLTWLMTSEEFIAESLQNKSGKNIGSRSIWFNGTRMNRQAGIHTEYCKSKFEKYIAHDFSRIVQVVSPPA